MVPIKMQTIVVCSVITAITELLMINIDKYSLGFYLSWSRMMVMTFSITIRVIFFGFQQYWGHIELSDGIFNKVNITCSCINWCYIWAVFSRKRIFTKNSPNVASFYTTTSYVCLVKNSITKFNMFPVLLETKKYYSNCDA